MRWANIVCLSGASKYNSFVSGEQATLNPGDNSQAYTRGDKLVCLRDMGCEA